MTDDWYDASELGSPYEVQLNSQSGRWRHRLRRPLSPGMELLTAIMECGLPWVFGRPPSKDIFNFKEIP